MPEDLKFTTENGVAPDDTGDYASVTGGNNVTQQIVLTVLREVGPFEGQPVTATNIEKYLASTRIALRELPYVNEIHTLRATNVTDEGVDIEIVTDSGEYTPTIPRS